MIFTELKKNVQPFNMGIVTGLPRWRSHAWPSHRGQTAHTLQGFPLRLLGGKGHQHTLALEVQYWKLTNLSNTFHCYHIELHCLLKQSCPKLLKETVTIQKSGGLAVNLTQMNYVWDPSCKTKFRFIIFLNLLSLRKHIHFPPISYICMHINIFAQHSLTWVNQWNVKPPILILATNLLLLKYVNLGIDITGLHQQMNL